YEFPGNVRELANILERAVIVAEGEEVSETNLPEVVRAAGKLRARESHRPTLAELEADYIRETLAATRGNKSQAARLLGISRKNLYERLRRDEGRDEGGGMRDEGKD
ncbi:MAG TPA: helix-turn-helix domain-containing protein, partial [Pyrinomonadaceae bacterium]|nr:helix-turn-helix domain-containing protein [Pyrinomonadaceae bacterium]